MDFSINYAGFLIIIADVLMSRFNQYNDALDYKKLGSIQNAGDAMDTFIVITER